MRRKGQGPAGVVRVDEASSASAFRELDDAFLQTQTKIWLGEVLHLRFDEDISVADLLADGELLFQVSKVIWKTLLKKNREQLKQSKVYIYERLSFGRSSGKYMPYSKVDSFLKICQILGLAGIDLFTPSDVVEKRNVRKVCICIRSISKRSRMMHLNVPDFDIVTYTVSMPNYIVGGIRRTLEQPQYSSSSSSGYSPRDNSKALQQQLIFDGQNDQNGDEAESRLIAQEPEDSVDGENFADMLAELSDAPKDGNEGYGEVGLDMHEEKSLAESTGPLNLGAIYSNSVDSTPVTDSKESSCWTQSATDRCSRTGTTKCSLSSEESEDSISSRLAFDSAKDDLELQAPPVASSERIHDVDAKPIDLSVPTNAEISSDSPNNGVVELQKDTVVVLDQRCDGDGLTCDRESVSSSCDEPEPGLNGESSDRTSELTPIMTGSGNKLQVDSEDPTNNTQPTGMSDGSTSAELKPELNTEDHGTAYKSVHKPDDIATSSISPHKPENGAPRPGKGGVLKSVAGGITLVGAVFFLVHLRRNKGRSFLTSFIPSLSKQPVQSDDSRRAKDVDKGKAAALYPGEWLKI